MGRGPQVNKFEQVYSGHMGYPPPTDTAENITSPYYVGCGNEHCKCIADT